jgi:hypothetical protein
VNREGFVVVVSGGGGELPETVNLVYRIKNPILFSLKAKNNENLVSHFD